MSAFARDIPSFLPIILDGLIILFQKQWRMSLVTSSAPVYTAVIPKPLPLSEFLTVLTGKISLSYF